LLEWLAYYQLEPFGEERDDLRAGSIAAAVYNVNMRSGARHLTPHDAALKFAKPQPPPKPLTEEEAAAKFRREFDAHKQTLIAIANNQ